MVCTSMTDTALLSVPMAMDTSNPVPLDPSMMILCPTRMEITTTPQPSVDRTMPMVLDSLATRGPTMGIHMDTMDRGYVMVHH